jgi:PAS domain S-box-containing protein
MAITLLVPEAISQPARQHQYSAAEMAGAPVTCLLSPAAVPEIQHILERVALGEILPPHETALHCKGGAPVDVAITFSPIRNSAGSVIGISKIARDLTQRNRAAAALRRTEEQFRQAQKMEAVGRLAGGVAHDFNNLLSVILCQTSLALEGLQPADPLRGEILEIEAAGKRAAELTRQLLAFSRQQVLQPRVIDLVQVITGMESMLSRLIGEDIKITARNSPDVGHVLADPGQIEQVVMNLAVNARDAMPDGGDLTLEMANVQLDATYAAAHLGVAAGQYVVLTVSDTGTGMDASTRARIFEPFFTTKEKGKGTGLGLSTVFGIVEQSGGHVSVFSEPGQGSTFRVYLPRRDRPVDPASRSSHAGMRGGWETILLVEDEDQLRSVSGSILRKNGYQVLESSRGGEALQVSQNFVGRIHLLLTDVVMPQMPGRKLAEQLASERPDLKVLFTSGYTDDAIAGHGGVNVGIPFLQKPFTPDGLLRKVREVLGPDPSDRLVDHRRPSVGWRGP